MRWSWKSMWSWFTRKRPAEPAATTMARGERGERGAWRRLPVLRTTVPTTPWTVAAPRTAVAATANPLIHRTAAPRRGEAPRGRVDGLVTAAPASVLSAAPSAPDEIGIADAGGVPGTVVVATGGGRPSHGVPERARTSTGSTGSVNTEYNATSDVTTADTSASSATASESHLPALPERRVVATGTAPAGGLLPRRLTRATDEFVGEPRPVTPPPTRSEFDVMLDAFRPAWMVRTDTDTPTYVQARMHQGNGPGGSDRPAPPDTAEPAATAEPPFRTGSRASLAESRKRNLAAGHTPQPPAEPTRTADDSGTDPPATRPDDASPTWEAAWSLRHARGASPQGRREEGAVEETTASDDRPAARHPAPRRGGGRVSAATESEEDISGVPAAAVTTVDSTAPAASDAAVAPPADTIVPSPALPSVSVGEASDIPPSDSVTREVSASAPPTGTTAETVGGSHGAAPYPSPPGPDSPMSPMARTDSPARGQAERSDAAPATDAAAASRSQGLPDHTGHGAPSERAARPTAPWPAAITPRPGTTDDGATARPAVGKGPEEQPAATPSHNAMTDGTAIPATPRSLPPPAAVSLRAVTRTDRGPVTLMARSALPGPAHDGPSAVTTYPPLVHRRGPVPLPPGGAAMLATPRTPWDPAVPVMPIPPSVPGGPPRPATPGAPPHTRADEGTDTGTDTHPAVDHPTPSGTRPAELRLVHSVAGDTVPADTRRHDAPRHLRAVPRQTVPDGEREPAAEQHGAVLAHAPAHMVWQEAVGGTSPLGDIPGLPMPGTRIAADGERLPLTHLRRRPHRTPVQPPTAVSAFEAPAQGTSSDASPAVHPAMDAGTSPGSPAGAPSPAAPPVDGGGGRAPGAADAPPPAASSQESGEWRRVSETLAVLSRRRLVDLDNPAHLDALADRLYERVITHVRRELVVERERHGLLTPPL